MDITNFYFRGNRNYLHSASLFDHIIENYVAKRYEPVNIDFSINKLTDRNCIIISKTQSEQFLGKIIGQYTDSLSQLIIYESNDKITQHFPYDEEEIKRHCKMVGNQRIICDDIRNYSFIDRAVAAYKFLLTSIFGEAYGKYLFARIMIDFIPKGNISVTHFRSISNSFFQGTISHKRNEIGTIIYGAKKV